MEENPNDYRHQAATRQIDSGSDPYRVLALSIIRQAVLDAKRGSVGARLWLANHAPAWLDACGVDYNLAAWRLRWG